MALIPKELPQGTALCQLMFVFTFSENSSAIETVTLTSYTDNTNALQVVKDPTDILMLQNDLNAIYKWGDENDIEFNSSAFQVLRY